MKTITRKIELYGKSVTTKKNKNNNTSIQNQQSNSGNVNNKNRTLLVGPSFSGKIYLMYVENFNRDIYIITK